MTIGGLAIDLLIPHHPEAIEYAQRLSGLKGTDGITLHAWNMTKEPRLLK